MEDRFGEDGLDERPPGHPENCEELSPPGQEGALEGARGETLRTVTIFPLEGTNAELRTRVLKEVRKPGRNYETIFRLLEEVRGPLEVQKYFIHQTIKEAARFKKRVLIQQLETALEEMEEKHLLPTGLNNVHGR